MYSFIKLSESLGILKIQSSKNVLSYFCCDHRCYPEEATKTCLKRALNLSDLISCYYCSFYQKQTKMAFRFIKHIPKTLFIKEFLSKTHLSFI